jgi:putative acetyltransferase
MIRLIRTDSGNADFVGLVGHLDAELASRDGEDHSFYAQYNTISAIKHALVAYEGTFAIGCGAIKKFNSRAMEVKRMYTLPEFRGKGIATRILGELEKWAKELEFETCVLETGLRQPEAIALYVKNGYRVIENYGQYAGVENSRCFEKKL